jgi:hypothetical protein
MAVGKHLPESFSSMYHAFLWSCSLTLYQHADNAQQAFSSDQAPTLHLAIPALEALHRAWSSCTEHAKYQQFVPALNAVCTKIDEYYEKTTESPAYIMAMGIYLALFVEKLLT